MPPEKPTEEDTPWILLIRDGSPFTTGMYIERAVQREYNVITAAINNYEPYNLFRRISPRPLHKFLDKIIKLKYGVSSHDPDLILVIDPVRGNFDFRNFSAPTAYYAIYSNVDFSRHIADAKVYNYDFVFVAQKDWVSKYKEFSCRNICWLPLACDPEIHRRWDLPLRHDLCFVGGLHGPLRGEIISKLRSEFKMFVGKAYLHDMAKIYSQSKIVFNESTRGDLNMRVFEAISCGRLLLTDRIGNGLEELFTDKKHLVIYDDYDDLVAKARYYLNNQEERELIASNGRQEAHYKHTYLHRVRCLVGTILGHN